MRTTHKNSPKITLARELHRNYGLLFTYSTAAHDHTSLCTVVRQADICLPPKTPQEVAPKQQMCLQCPYKQRKKGRENLYKNNTRPRQDPNRTQTALRQHPHKIQTGPRQDSRKRGREILDENNTQK